MTPDPDTPTLGELGRAIGRLEEGMHIMERKLDSKLVGGEALKNIETAWQLRLDGMLVMLRGEIKDVKAVADDNERRVGKVEGNVVWVVRAILLIVITAVLATVLGGGVR